MNNFYKSEEKFKILEYSDYMVIKPNNKIKYEYSMFFFAGFNENAAKYSYLFKIFLENISFTLPIKIVIPFLPTYKKEEYPSTWMTNPEKFSQINAWFNYEIHVNEDKTLKFKLLPNVEKDEKIIQMVRYEIEKLGSSEKIIFSGFSMGGNYLLEILTKMNIKTKFNLMFKTNMVLYKKPVGEEYSEFSKNKFYFYFSANDKIVNYTRSIDSIRILKREFGDVKVKFDNGVTSHTVDYKCLAFLEQILSREIRGERANF